MDGEVDFYDIDDTDAWDKIDLDPVNDYVFYNWEDNRSPVEGTEAYSLRAKVIFRAFQIQIIYPVISLTVI